jgi:hypothetical protein
MTRPSIKDCSDVHSHRLEGRIPVRTPGKKDKPLWAPTFGGPTETKKARSVVASSRVPRLAGFAGSPPAAGLPGAVDWPLVQIPADRHATTGTCVLGESLFVRIAPWRKRFSRSEATILRQRHKIVRNQKLAGRRSASPRAGRRRRLAIFRLDLKRFQIESFPNCTLFSCPVGPSLISDCQRPQTLHLPAGGDAMTIRWGAAFSARRPMAASLFAAGVSGRSAADVQTADAGAQSLGGTRRAAGDQLAPERRVFGSMVAPSGPRSGRRAAAAARPAKISASASRMSRGGARTRRSKANSRSATRTAR